MQFTASTQQRYDINAQNTTKMEQKPVFCTKCNELTQKSLLFKKFCFPVPIAGLHH